MQLNDTRLLEQLYAKNAHTFRKAVDLPLQDLRSFLDLRKTLDVPIIRGHSVVVDGEVWPLALVAATDIRTSHGEMSSMLYLRDHIQVARVYIELFLHDPHAYASEGAVGRDLLLSALHLMSTPPQLDRFRVVIQKGSYASQEEWPHISLWFNDLDGKNANGWRNNQDSFQMLAHLTFDAIDQGFLDVDDLLAAHKQFLGLIVPLLKSVGFPCHESSGSWEENAAVRSSVMAIETALLAKIKDCSQKPTFVFLEQMFAQNTSGDFYSTVEQLLYNGLKELGRCLPYESPDYDKGSVKYREADAALVYVLMYGLPQLLANAKILVRGAQRDQRAIETMILETLATLDDPLTGGMRRYLGDSYQRVNFHTAEVQETIRQIKKTILDEARQSRQPVDLDKKQQLRGELTPQGREAAWTHPLGQLAAWSAKQALGVKPGEDRRHYEELCRLYLDRMLGTITAERQWNAVLDKQGGYQLKKVPAWRLPECYITYQLAEKEPLVVPSPHTPLNWSSVSLKEAVGLVTILRLKK
jgi:hypothetical protein